MNIKIGDSIWHPCNLDIIEYKVISIRQFEGFNHYVLNSIRNVGACGRIQVIVSENKGKLRFIELVNEKDIEYSSGLGNFVEGDYFTNLNEAKIYYYEEQRLLSLSHMENRKRLYEESLRHYNQVESLIKELKSNLI